MQLWLSTIIALGFVFSMSLLLLVVCRDASVHFNGIKGKSDKYILSAWFHRFYFLLTTLTTIGYGDITPASITAKLFVVLTMFVVIGVVMGALNNVPKFLKETVHDNIQKSLNKENKQ